MILDLRVLVLVGIAPFAMAALARVTNSARPGQNAPARQWRGDLFIQPRKHPMTPPFARGKSNAAEQTRPGKLEDAAAMIQSLLQTGDPQRAGEGLIEDAFPRRDADAPGPKPRAARTRKGLRDTLRGIAAGGMPPHDGLATMPPVMTEKAQFLALTHDGAEGNRDYRLYVPATRPAGRMPLIVMLHGCSQTPEDFAAGTGMNVLAEQFGCLIAWPAQPQGANAQKCWNWFRPEDQARDHGEPALIAGIVRDILRDHPADPTRVYAAGLSAGGSAAAIMGAAYPEVFAAVGVHSGLPVGGAQDVMSAFTAMRSGSTGNDQPLVVPTIVFHGLADSTVHPGNGDAVLAQAMLARSGLKRTRVNGNTEGGRAYRQTRHTDADGRSMAEHWEIDGAGHAWSGGQAGGSFTDPKGPDASGEMLRFFLQHRLA